MTTLSYERALKTEYGVYKFKGNKDVLTFYSIGAVQKEIGVVLNIGGRDNYCVQIKVPYEGTVGKILWIQSGKKNECSIDNEEQHGEKLIHMVHLGITIAKEYNSKLEYLELNDSASFDCILPDDKKVAMNATDHDIAFYQQSYYEKRYGAVLIDAKLNEEYENDKKRFIDKAKKPPLFDFMNNDIEKELMPLYSSSETWKEFFDKINEIYKKKKCSVVSVWLKSALLHIFNNRSYSGLNWSIDIRNMPYIRYEERKLVKSGGRSRKQKKYVREPYLPEILAMDWKGYFKQFKTRDS